MNSEETKNVSIIRTLAQYRMPEFKEEVMITFTGPDVTDKDAKTFDRLQRDLGWRIRSIQAQSVGEVTDWRRSL